MRYEMKKRFVLYNLLTLLFTVFSLSATGQKYGNGLIDKTVALIGNDMIQLSAIEAEVQMLLFQGVTSEKNLRCEVLENLLVHKLFLTQARLDSLTANTDMVESNLNSRIQYYMGNLGGEKAMEEYFKKPIYKIKQEWREALTEQSLVQTLQSNIAQKAPALTPKEIKEYYKKNPTDSIISTQYQYRQLVLYPEQEEAILAVKEKLLEFRERIMKGEKFSTLATIYSQDPRSAARGGELGMASKQDYYASFSDAAMSLKAGQVSQIVETPEGYHLIQLIKKEGDLFNARHILLRPVYTSADREKAFKTLDSLKLLIINDSITFDQAVKRFSQDIKSFMNGGLVADENSGSTYFDKDNLNHLDYNVIKDLKIGEISDPFESRDNEGREGRTIYKIIKIEKIIPSHVANYETDFAVLQMMAKDKASRDAIEEFIKRKQATTFIRIDPLFSHCVFQRNGWIK
jgi:peptidyl-prolyl cis-trans isomerase SurA